MMVLSRGAGKLHMAAINTCTDLIELHVAAARLWAVLL